MREDSLKQQPLIVSHGACSAINPSWRNLDDEQIKQIADRGGVIGIIAHSFYLNGNFINGKLDDMIAHLEHMKQIGGEDVLAFGSDFDGAIIPSAEFPNCSAMPALVRRLFERGWTEKSVIKFLGANYLRSLSSSQT